MGDVQIPFIEDKPASLLFGEEEYTSNNILENKQDLSSSNYFKPDDDT